MNISDNETFYEVSKVQIWVNDYERNPDARRKCIEYYGCYCHACNFNFENYYGAMGKGVIHVHHIKSLHEINEQYIVDPINVLIPVCPNCHAMLHRKINSQYLSVEELKLNMTKQLN